MASLPFVFNSTCDIKHKQIGTNSFNEEVITYAEDLNLKDIPCYREPASGSEVRTPNQTYSLSIYIIVLQGYYPTVGLGDLLVFNDDNSYNIQRVVHDDTETLSIVTCEIVNAPDEL